MEKLENNLCTCTNLASTDYAECDLLTGTAPSIFMPYVCFPHKLVHTASESRTGCHFLGIRHSRIFHNFQSVSCKNTTACMPHKDRRLLVEDTGQVCPLHLPHIRLDHWSPDTRYLDHTILLHMRKMVDWNLKN